VAEAEWLACEKPEVVLAASAGAVSDRKRRLAVCACFRRCDVVGSAWWLAALEEGVALAEGLDDNATTRERRCALGTELGHWMRYSSWRIPPWVYLIYRTTLGGSCSLEETVKAVAAYSRSARERDSAVERLAQATLLRDIFGNPFRPVAFSPQWRTDTAVALARQLYESRDFGAMPILADALQDAGCDSADVLGHCRGEGPHVRGCWVVDLVLGKE
jgi:hypothetical protein